MKIKTIDVSGFGGSYENACQQMLWAGVDWLDKNPGPITFEEIENVTGIIFTKDRAKELEFYIVDAVKGERPSGAMVHCVMGHLRFISKNSLSKWLDEFKDMPDRVFEWDGTESSIPTAIID